MVDHQEKLVPIIPFAEGAPPIAEVFLVETDRLPPHERVAAYSELLSGIYLRLERFMRDGGPDPETRTALAALGNTTGDARAAIKVLLERFPADHSEPIGRAKGW